MARIDELYSGPERKAALVGLLEQEAYLIASIDRHKLVADDENKDKRIKNFLNKVCVDGCVFVRVTLDFRLFEARLKSFKKIVIVFFVCLFIFLSCLIYY